MDFSTGASLGQLLLALATTLVTGGVAWGSLAQRVKSLEHEFEAFSGLAERLTRIEEQTGYANRQLDKLTGSWLFKEPVGYGRPLQRRKSSGE
jgi:hypothetical protein